MQTDWRKGSTPTPRPHRGRPQRLAPGEEPRPSPVRRLRLVLLAMTALGLIALLAGAWLGL